MVVLKNVFSRLIAISIGLIISTSLFSQDIENIGKANPFTINGDVSLTTSAYGFSSSDSMKARAVPFSGILSANINASIYGIALPFSFTYSNQDKSYRQPFNQFGLNPSYKWAKLHLGYSSLNYSPYTLANHTISGVGVDITPKNLRFGFIYGRFNRKIGEYDNSRNVVPTYTRKGFATHVGYGNEKNYVDLIFLKAKDNEHSIAAFESDSLTKPAENLVAGISARGKKKNFFAEADAAYSVYTSNFLIDSTKDNSKIYSSLLTVNNTTNECAAISGAVGYKSKLYGAKLQYKRVDPLFMSMGAYYLNSDFQNITIAPNASLFKKKVIISGSFGVQRDNLKNTKRATSYRKIGSANLSVNPNQTFGFTGSYSNYSSDQKSGKVPLVDTLRLYQVNQNMMLMPRLTFIDTSKVQMILLMFNTMKLHDKNPVTAKYCDFTTNNLLLNYSVSLIKSGLSINGGLNYTIINLQSGNNKTYGLTWGLARSFLHNKLSTSLTNVLNKSSFNGANGTVENLIIALNYTLSKNHTFNINLCYNGNSSKSKDNPSFNEYKGDFTYVYRFGK